MKRGLGAVMAAMAVAVPGMAEAAETRYSLANGCFSVTDTGRKKIAEKARLKATTLGRYMLYLPDATFVSAQEDGSFAPAAQPSPAADFEVEEAGGDTFTMAPASTARTALLCAVNL